MRKSKSKDFSVLRDTESAKTQYKKSRAALKDYSLSHQVVMEWDLNEDAKRDRMFRLTVGGNTVILDYEELLKSGRWI